MREEERKLVVLFASRVRKRITAYPVKDIPQGKVVAQKGKNARFRK